MGVDCTVRFANGLGSESHLDITVYYKTDDTEDEIQVKKIHIDGSDYESLTFNYLEKVYCKTAGGYAYVDLDTNAFDGQESTAYFTTNEYWSSDVSVYNLVWESGGKLRERWAFK